MISSQKPVARKNSLVVQQHDNEVLVYDLESNKAHCLNESAAFVWKNCDGSKTITDITSEFANFYGKGVDENLVWLAIDQLNDSKLLDHEMKPNFDGQTRRQVLKKIGLASVVALPLISSLVAPQAAFAALSCNAGAACTPGPVGGPHPGCLVGCTQCLALICAP